MRGVFLSSLKLAAVHALFSWLTLTLSGAHFVYLLSAASAGLALVPLAPVWVVALPAAAQLALLGRAPAALTLLALHLGCYALVDDVILSEMQPSTPYLTSENAGGCPAAWLTCVACRPQGPTHDMLARATTHACMAAGSHLHARMRVMIMVVTCA